MLLNIHSATGWELPTGNMRQIVERQLIATLLEKYSNLNFTEIELAFRTLAHEVQEYGKPFNMALFNQVLELYLYNRKTISDMEQSRQKQPELELPTMTDEERQTYLEETKLAYLCGRLQLRMLPIDCYNYALRVGHIAPTREEKWDAYFQAGQILNPEGNAKVLHDTAEMLSKQIILSKYFKK
jgi:hypothetical protein